MPPKGVRKRKIQENDEEEDGDGIDGNCTWQFITTSVHGNS
jgi:hypothetical protein